MLDWNALQKRIADELPVAREADDDEVGRGGYWSSLQQLAADPHVADQLAGRPPRGEAEGTSRRDFLRVMSASLALAGASGCRAPDEQILPYVEMPEGITPGKPLFYATAMPWLDHGLGLVVETHMGRPTKIEGNPSHPSSRGATSAIAQASILDLYDPDRSRAIRRLRAVASDDIFRRELRVASSILANRRGAGLRILTETVTSPTLVGQLQQLLERWPDARWYQYSPVSNDNLLAGAEQAFGRRALPVFDFRRAGVVLAIEADFLSAVHWPVSYAGDFMDRRRLADQSLGQARMNRLYAVESTPTLTGTKADHRWRLTPPELLQFTRALAARLGVDTGTGDRAWPASIPAAWGDALVEDLLAASRQGEDDRPVVMVGREQPAPLHALACAINGALGSIGTAVWYHESFDGAGADQAAAIRELAEEMRAGEVETLVIIGGNPAFDAPADLEFDRLLADVPQSLHLGLYLNETGAVCQWHLPARHFLESWSDVWGHDGTASIIQPMIAPLYAGWSEHELLAELIGEPQSAYDLVREHWRSGALADDFENRWEAALREGVIAGTPAEPLELGAPASGASLAAAPEETDEGVSAASGYHVLFRPDPTVWDGRLANNAWLQELPKPLTKLTWDNAALMSATTAERLGVSNGRMVKLVRGERQVMLPALVLPGQADDTITVHWGYGRRVVGRVGQGTGFDVYPLRTNDALWHATGVTVEPSEVEHRLAITQGHFQMEQRDPVRAGTLQDVLEHADEPPFMHAGHASPPANLLGEWEYNSYKWGMVIDLTACTGCNACVTACQAENNIPTVGKDEVIRAREMHWLRIDTYFDGDAANPRTFHQPLACVHCEKAPCEVVCPVAATTHSDEGLNEMTYNRCVGTRYCSNNCPYKVRRFNFLQYADLETPVLKLLRNPDVTVRTRGVMEKCTYCVQRINAARVGAGREDRTIGGDEVETACQAACPTRAIVFGDLNNSESTVVRWKQSPLDYGLLADLNTQPRTSYLAAVSNPNPAIKEDAAS